MVSSSSPPSSLSKSRKDITDTLNNHNDNNHDNNISNGTNNTPPALTSFMEKCLTRYQDLPDHIQTDINLQKLKVNSIIYIIHLF